MWTIIKTKIVGKLCIFRYVNTKDREVVTINSEECRTIIFFVRNNAKKEVRNLLWYSLDCIRVNT